MAVIAAVEEKFVGQFVFLLYTDTGRTGRHEFTVFANSVNDQGGEGEVVFSKAQSGKQPTEDMELVLGMIEAAIE